MNLSNTVREILASHHPGLPYDKLPPSMQKQIDKATQKILAEFEKAGLEIIGEDLEHTQPCQFAKDNLYTKKTAENFCMCGVRQENNRRAEQRQRLTQLGSKAGKEE